MATEKHISGRQSSAPPKQGDSARAEAGVTPAASQQHHRRNAPRDPQGTAPARLAAISVLLALGKVSTLLEIFDDVCSDHPGQAVYQSKFQCLEASISLWVVRACARFEESVCGSYADAAIHEAVALADGELNDLRCATKLMTATLGQHHVAGRDDYADCLHGSLIGLERAVGSATATVGNVAAMLGHSTGDSSVTLEVQHV